MKRYTLALDLVNEPAKIREYEDYHKNVWPEIKKSITDSGILSMEIYRAGNRLFMIIEAADDFSFDRKKQLDDANPHVAEWEKLMWNFQQPLPFAKPGEKWVLMEKIFSLP
jgi:L-rhamnose mutarotase